MTRHCIIAPGRGRVQRGDFDHVDRGLRGSRIGVGRRVLNHADEGASVQWWLGADLVRPKRGVFDRTQAVAAGDIRRRSARSGGRLTEHPEIFLNFSAHIVERFLNSPPGDASKCRMPFITDDHACSGKVVALGKHVVD